eukprot:scaffold53688_cov57-Phaeocystis_antarctica.AAC.4
MHRANAWAHMATAPAGSSAVELNARRAAARRARVDEVAVREETLQQAHEGGARHDLARRLRHAAERRVGAVQQWRQGVPHPQRL